MPDGVFEGFCAMAAHDDLIVYIVFKMLLSSLLLILVVMRT